MPPGQPVIDFTEVESGIFEGLRQGEGVYILQNLAAARSLAKSMDQMIGDWPMVRGNGQADLRADADQHRGRRRQFPGLRQAEMRSRGRSLRADAMAARARPDDPDVEDGETWQFEADDNAQWRRVPDSADGLIMLRGQ